MSSAVRNFLVVFFLALLGFGILGHFIATVAVPSFVYDDGQTDFSSEDVVSEEEVESTDDTVSTDTVVSGNKFNFAFICLDTNDKLAGVYLMHTDDGYKTCVSVSIPGNASVENNGAFSTLSQLYSDKGEDFLLTKLYYLTGCKIDEHASVCAVDTSGNGRDVTQLSTYLKYTYKIKESFEFPNPNYNRGEADPESSEDNPNDNMEFITVEAGSYALNGQTNDVQNDKMLLDTQYNKNAFEIYNDLLTRIINDETLVGNTQKQTKIMGYMLNKSFRDYGNSGAGLYLFNDYVKASINYSGTGGAWDEIREAIKTLERKV